MSVFEISLLVSRVVAIAFDLYLLAIGLRALRATPGTFRFNAGVTLVMLGVGLLLTYADRVVTDSSAPAVSVMLWLGVALAAVGCVRLIQLVRTPDQRWDEIRSLFR